VLSAEYPDACNDNTDNREGNGLQYRRGAKKERSHATCKAGDACIPTYLCRGLDLDMGKSGRENVPQSVGNPL